MVASKKRGARPAQGAARRRGLARRFVMFASSQNTSRYQIVASQPLMPTVSGDQNSKRRATGCSATSTGDGVCRVAQGFALAAGMGPRICHLNVAPSYRRDQRHVPSRRRPRCPSRDGSSLATIARSARTLIVSPTIAYGFILSRGVYADPEFSPASQFRPPAKFSAVPQCAPAAFFPYSFLFPFKALVGRRPVLLRKAPAQGSGRRIPEWSQRRVPRAFAHQLSDPLAATVAGTPPLSLVPISIVASPLHRGVPTPLPRLPGTPRVLALGSPTAGLHPTLRMFVAVELLQRRPSSMCPSRSRHLHGSTAGPTQSSRLLRCRIRISTVPVT